MKVLCANTTLLVPSTALIPHCQPVVNINLRVLREIENPQQDYYLTIGANRKTHGVHLDRFQLPGHLTPTNKC